jgi:hypothetical protein
MLAKYEWRGEQASPIVPKAPPHKQPVDKGKSQHSSNKKHHNRKQQHLKKTGGPLQ